MSDRTFRGAMQDWMRSIIDTDDGNLILGTLLIVSPDEFARLTGDRVEAAVAAGLIEAKGYKSGDLLYGFTDYAIEMLSVGLAASPTDESRMSE